MELIIFNPCLQPSSTLAGTRP